MRPAARIMAGIEDALAWANGDDSRARIVTVERPAKSIRVATARKAIAETGKRAKGKKLGKRGLKPSSR